MNLQVQSLKVLATREVVTKRLDYSTYLNGTTKDELDGLGRLAGNYKIHASKTTIDALYGGKRVKFVSPRGGPVSDWEHFKGIFESIYRATLTKFIEGKEEFSIVESKTGPREWVISDVDGVERVWFSGRSDLKQKSRLWHRHDHFIEDGALVILYERYNEEMKKDLNVKNFITADKQGNIFRKFTWTQALYPLDNQTAFKKLNLPNVEVMITKVMWAHRVPAYSCTIS